MALAAPKPSELFDDQARSAAEIAQRFDTYQKSLSATHAESDAGHVRVVGNDGGTGQTLIKGVGATKRSLEGMTERVDNIQKALGSTAAASIQDDLTALKASLQADLTKDWSIAFPDTAGLVPYDLEAPAKLLVPRVTPLRNRLPRTKGQGTALQIKRILGWTNSSSGGIADASAFFSSESVSTAFGPISLRRPPKITYAASDKTFAYMEQGVSDSVTFKAQFAGQGYQDIRSLSQTAALWASLGAEERSLLFARGTGANGYAGAVAAPVISSATATTGGALAAGVWQIKVTARAGFGESVVSNELAQTTTGATSTITVTVGTEPTGALGYNLYVSLVGGASNSETFQYAFVGNTTTFGAQIPGGAAQPGAVDTSASSLAYDGFLTVQADPTQSGYVKRVNSSVLANGDKAWQDAFLALWGGNLNPGGGATNGNKLLADPDEIWIDGQTRNSLGQWLKLNASTVSYRLNLNVNDRDGIGGGAVIGSVVGGISNQTTGSMVDLGVHPYMPLGTSLLRSSRLPIPNSEIGNTAEVRNVQDYMSIDWPVLQMTYDISTYWFGTLVHYAPAWSGMLIGLLP